MRGEKGLLAAVLLAGGTPALAQQVVDQAPVLSGAIQLIPRRVGVADREQPDYKPIGGRLGSFILYPRATIEAGITDNVRATDTDKRTVGALTVNPGFSLRSLWARNRLVIDGHYSRVLHSEVTDEDYSQFGGSAEARIYTQADSHWDMAVNAERLVDRRETINNIAAARSPVHFGRYQAGVGYTFVANRLTLIGTAIARKLDYADARDRAGGVIDQSYRNYTALNGRAEARYQLPGGLIALGRFDYYRLRYEFGPEDAGFDPTVDRDRDSRRIRAEGGIGFQITDILYGDVTAGYQDRRYARQPLPQNRLRSISGPTFSADLLWNATRRTTVTLTADRGFLESASPTIAGYVSTGGKLTVDQEVLRPLILSATAGYTHYNPIGPASNRKEYVFGTSARYLINRRYSLTARYEHNGRRSNTDDFVQPFDENYVGIGIGVAL